MLFLNNISQGKSYINTEDDSSQSFVENLSNLFVLLNVFPFAKHSSALLNW